MSRSGVAQQSMSYDAETQHADLDGDKPTKGPKHVAVIMDGNGRWATQRGMPRVAGHKSGVESLRRVIKACPGYGITHLTIYAFSTENWKRPPEEVNALMGLFKLYLTREAKTLKKQGVSIRFIGDRTALSDELQKLMGSIEDLTKDNTSLILTVAINYGARAEIVSAAQRLAARVANGEITADQIDEDMFSAAVSLGDLPPPDLMIRTSGEQRLSNFLLWQLAYSEFVFTTEHWPDFDGEVLGKVLDQYAHRDRRFGAVSNG